MGYVPGEALTIPSPSLLFDPDMDAATVIKNADANMSSTEEFPPQNLEGFSYTNTNIRHIRGRHGSRLPTHRDITQTHTAARHRFNKSLRCREHSPRQVDVGGRPQFLVN